MKSTKQRDLVSLVLLFITLFIENVGADIFSSGAYG